MKQGEFLASVCRFLQQVEHKRNASPDLPISNKKIKKQPGTQKSNGYDND